MANLIKSVERYKNDPTTTKENVEMYKQKINEYKAKVKLANATIAKMSQI